MPPKTVTCSICGQTVMKSQTFGRADGSRACRSHEEVAEEATKRIATDRTRLLRAMAHPKRKTWDLYNSERDAASVATYAAQAAEFREHAHTHCWACDGEGISLQEYSAEMLVAFERLRLRGEFHLLTVHEDAYRLMGRPRILFMLPYREATDRAMLPRLIWKMRDIVPLMGEMLLCGDCGRRYGYTARMAERIPRPSFEQVQAIMPVMAMVQPVLEALAEKKEKLS